MHEKNICIVGLGYIGLPSAALLSSQGYSVLGCDVNPLIVAKINQGLPHIAEPDLDRYVSSAIASGKLQAFLTPQLADIYMICVPTPFHSCGDIPQPNIDYVLSAARSIAQLIKPGDMLILESTSPVGTTQKIADTLGAVGIDTSKIDIAYCPERVLPGKIMTELVENDRIVGGITPQAASRIANFYRTFVSGTVLETDSKTAEMCKLTENTFRDVNIAFANELSLICAKEGIDVWRLIQLANCHPRVNILQPGTGVGGHCIAVDPWFIVARDPENAQMIRMAREVNNQKTEWVIDQIGTLAKDVSKEKGINVKIACFGLAFKPDIDDLRESAAVNVVEALLAKGFNILVVDPNIKESDRFNLVSLDEALECSDVIAILVKHKEFIDAAVEGKFLHKSVINFCGIAI